MGFNFYVLGSRPALSPFIVLFYEGTQVEKIGNSDVVIFILLPISIIIIYWYHLCGIFTKTPSNLSNNKISGCFYFKQKKFPLKPTIRSNAELVVIRPMHIQFISYLWTIHHQKSLLSWKAKRKSKGPFFG